MNGNEIEILREEIRRIHSDNKENSKEIKETLNNLGGALTNIHLIIVEDYIKRDEFEEGRKEMLKEMEKLEQEHKSDIKDMRNEKYRIAGLAGSFAGIITSIIFGIMNVFK